MKNKLLKLAKLLPNYSEKIIVLSQIKDNINFTPVEGQIVLRRSRYSSTYGKGEMHLLIKSDKNEVGFAIMPDFSYSPETLFDYNIITPIFTPGIDNKNSFPNQLVDIYDLYRFTFIKELESEDDENTCINILKKEIEEQNGQSGRSYQEKEIVKYITFCFLEKYPEFFNVIYNFLSKVDGEENIKKYKNQSYAKNTFNSFIEMSIDSFINTGTVKDKSFYQNIFKISEFSNSSLYGILNLDKLPNEIKILVEDDLQSIFERNPVQYYDSRSLYKKYSRYLKVGFVDDIRVLKKYSEQFPLLFIESYKQGKFDYNEEVKIEAIELLSEAYRILYKNVPYAFSDKDISTLDEATEYKLFLIENYPERLLYYFSVSEERMAGREELIIKSLDSLITRYNGNISEFIIKFKNFIKHTYDEFINKYMKYNNSNEEIKKYSLKSLIRYENNNNILKMLYQNYLLLEKNIYSIISLIDQNITSDKLSEFEFNLIKSMIENSNDKKIFIDRFFAISDSKEHINKNLNFYKMLIDELSKINIDNEHDKNYTINTIKNRVDEQFFNYFKEKCNHLFTQEQ